MKDGTEATCAANRAALAQVPLADQQSFEDARRGFIEALGDKMITRADGRRSRYASRSSKPRPAR